MKNFVLFYVLFLWGILLTSCGGTQSAPSAAAEAGDFAKWEAWSITWQHSQTFGDVTVKMEDKQKTYLPEQKNYVFLALKAELLNISQETQDMRFWQDAIYLTDPRSQNVYPLVGVAHSDVILMAPPYLLEDKTRLQTGRWDDGRFMTVAYQRKPQSWFIQATPNSLFHVDFLFTVPEDFEDLVLHFGNGMIVNIH
jgi:hypothetical protein